MCFNNNEYYLCQYYVESKIYLLLQGSSLKGQFTFHLLESHTSNLDYLPYTEKD